MAIGIISAMPIELKGLLEKVHVYEQKNSINN